MNQEIIIWAILVSATVLALAVKTISELQDHKKHHFIEISSEKEMFYYPDEIERPEENL